MTESGLENGTTTPGQFGLYVSGDPSLSSGVVYNRLEASANGGSKRPTTTEAVMDAEVASGLLASMRALHSERWHEMELAPPSQLPCALSDNPQEAPES